MLSSTAMGRLTLALVLVAACGGVQIPTGNGYKSEKAKPWKKPKALKFDDKLEAKAEGDLSYPLAKRAAWFSIDITQLSALDLRLQITPPGDPATDALAL